MKEIENLKKELAKAGKIAEQRLAMVNESVKHLSTENGKLKGEITLLTQQNGKLKARIEELEK